MTVVDKDDVPDVPSSPYRLGEFVRCNRCKLVYEITCEAPRLVTINPTLVVDHTAEFCEACVKPTDVAAVLRRLVSERNGTANN